MMFEPSAMKIVLAFRIVTVGFTPTMPGLIEMLSESGTKTNDAPALEKSWNIKTERFCLPLQGFIETNALHVWPSVTNPKKSGVDETEKVGPSPTTEE